MKLIVERWEGALYVYRETKAHHKKAEKTRQTPLLDSDCLANDCDIGHIQGDFHMVFDLKKK